MTDTADSTTQAQASTDAPWYAAMDCDSVAGLVTTYGDVSVTWAAGNAGHYGRMVASAAAGDGRAALRFAWATYLENARIRELTQGEG